MKLEVQFGCTMPAYHNILKNLNINLLDHLPSNFGFTIHSPSTDRPLASRLLQLVDSFMAEQDQAIHGCLSCSIQEAHWLLNWATFALVTGPISHFCNQCKINGSESLNI